MDNKISQLDFIKMINDFKMRYPGKFSNFNLSQNSESTTRFENSLVRFEHIAASKNKTTITFMDTHYKYIIDKKESLWVLLNTIARNNNYMERLHHYAKGVLKEL
jgi:hypothetical protein